MLELEEQKAKKVEMQTLEDYDRQLQNDYEATSADDIDGVDSPECGAERG